MAYLLDTHTFLWFISGHKQLPESVVKKIEDISEPCYISIASFWEIAIKIQIGKLKIEISLEELYRFAEINQIEIISINEKHLLTLLKLGLIHNDPFDRLIIAQAISEKLIVVTKDKEFKKYKVKQQWE
jgi:PIN domain nuclease of toxin-antitoxin system